MKLQKFTAATMLAASFIVCTAPIGAQSVGNASAVENVRRELLHLPYYGVFDFLSFSYANGRVTLVGYANQPALRTDAERAMTRAAGVTTVVDNVEVLPMSREDDELRWKVYYSIFNDPFIANYMSGGTLLWGHTHPFPAGSLLALGPQRFPGTEPAGNYPIHIIVKQGRVTLLGVVDSDGDKMQAGLLARRVKGSPEVENELVVDTQP
jgi:hyperosmotically inducible protein